MVFYNPSKSQRRRRRDGDTSKTSITDLPDELLIAVSHDLSNLDILRLRVSHPILTPACTTIISERLTRLYVHPTPRSLQIALKVCEHPIFSQKIEELVFLGKVLEQPDETPDWLRGMSGRGESYPVALMHIEQHIESLDMHGIYKPWPTSYPGPKKSLSRNEEATSQDCGAAHMDFADAYRPFLDALAKLLPKLSTLSFSEEATTTPGFNGTRESAVVSFAKRIEKEAEVAVQQNSTTKTKPPARTKTPAPKSLPAGQRRSDIEIL
jgi:hypothetical protein